MEERAIEKELNCPLDGIGRRGARWGAPWTAVLGALALFLFAGGCGWYDDGESVSEERERGFQRGKQLLREGRHADALGAFRGVIEKRTGDAPESHLEAADILLNRMEEPVEAIYHYRRYLEQMPDSPQAELVRGQIDRAMKELVRTLPAQPLQYPLERQDLRAAVEELEDENRDLRRQVAALRDERERLAAEAREAANRAETERRRAEQAASAEREREAQGRSAEAARERASPDSAESENAESAPDRTETYTVREGDSLYGISRQMYGTPNRWQEIYEANRDILPDENSVRVGMTLEIPRE